MSKAIDKSAAINKIKAQQQQAAAASKGAAAATPAANSAAAPAASSAASRVVGARHAPLSTGRTRWAVDLTESRAAPNTFLVSSSSASSKDDLIPFGFSNHGSVDSYSGAVEEKSARDEAKHADLIYKSAMALAQAPGKQLLMTCFMLWMSGNSLQIFSIMMLSMALWTPISEMMQVGARFARFDDSGVDMTLPKITFIAIHLAGLALGLYKCNTMGLLPTSTADWIDTSLRVPVQVSGGGII